MNILHLGKLVGRINDHRFITHRRPDHYFIKFRGFGLSCAVLAQLKKHKVTEIVILYHTTFGHVKAYYTHPQAFYAYGKPWTDKQADNQLILPTQHMHERQPK